MMRRSIRRGFTATAILLLALLFIGPWLIDREALRTSLVEQLSTVLGSTVEIAHLNIRFVPQPAITLEQTAISFGEHAEDTLKIDHIHATLDAFALLVPQIRFTRIEVNSLALNARIVERLRSIVATLNKGATGGSVDVRLERASINDVTWITDDNLKLGPFTVTTDWQDDSLPQEIVIEQDDGRLRARVGISGEAIDAHLQAHEWTTPVHAPLHQPLQINELQAHVSYSEGQLEISSADMVGAVGQLRLSGRLEWRDTWRFNGKLSGERLDLPLLLGSFGQPALPGHVGGECTLELQAPDAAQLFAQPALDCVLRHAHAGEEARLTLVTQTDADALKYTVRARNLTLPLGPALHFDTLDMNGRLIRGQLTFSMAQATAYRGEVKMQGDLSWHTGWQWNFTVHSRQVRLSPLLSVFGQNDLDGNLDADCQGRLAGASFNVLFQKPDLNCDFTLTGGVLRNADLERATKLINLGSETAGDTPFDHLSGRLRMHGGQTHFTGLKLRSTALEAKGDVSIDQGKNLSGRLSAGVRNTGDMVSVPLLVSGTVGDPVIRPTTSAMAGGAAGTMLLGPGVGTAVGVKVGEAFNKIGGWLKPKPGNESAQE